MGIILSIFVKAWVTMTKTYVFFLGRSSFGFSVGTNCQRGRDRQMSNLLHSLSLLFSFVSFFSGKKVHGVK